jgi:hypothetical protein
VVLSAEPEGRVDAEDRTPDQPAGSEADGCEVRTAASAPAATTAKNGMPNTSLRTVRLYPRQRKLAIGLLALRTTNKDKV